MTTPLGRYDPRNFAVVSSGDEETDQREIREYIKSRALMDEGLCPNGCGPLSACKEAFGGSECRACGFWCNRDMPLDGTDG